MVSRLLWFAVLGILPCLAVDDGEDAKTEGFELDSVSERDFRALKISSPFVRPLDQSSQFILTGLAQIDGKQVATLLNKETNEVRVITNNTNSSGWQLIEVKGDPKDLESVTVRVSSGGGEIVYVRYDKTLMEKRTPPRTRVRIPPGEAAEIAEQARNFRQGIRGDGHRGPPPPELTAKLARLSEKQRGELIYKMSEMRRQGVSSEDRQKAFGQMVDQALKQRR